MKKDKNRRPLNYSAYSHDYGVTFVSGRRMVAVVSDGINNYILEKNVEHKKKEKFSLTAKQIAIAILLVLGFSLYQILFVILQLVLMEYDVRVAFYLVLNAIIMGFLFKKMKWVFDVGGPNLRKYHGAEHMAANAYIRYGYVPELSEIKKEKRYSSRCGVRRISNFLLLINLSFVFSFTEYLYLPLYILWQIADTFPFASFYSPLIQYFISTRKPNDEELNVARLAIAYLDELEYGDHKISDTFSYDEELDVMFVRRENVEVSEPLFDIRTERDEIEETVLNQRRIFN